MCREETRSMNFWRGVPPVEADTGVFRDSRRRTGRSLILNMWQVTVQVNGQNAARSKPVPRFGIRACSERFSDIYLFYSERYESAPGEWPWPGPSCLLLNPCSLSLNPLGYLDAGPFLGLPSLGANMACHNRGPIRKVDEFLLPLVHGRLKMEHV